MVAYGADFGSLGAHYQVAAVAAFPQGDTGLLKDGLGLDVVQQGAVALLVGLLDGGNTAELLGQSMEALFFGVLSHAVIHIGPLVVLALSGVQQVLGGVAQLAQSLEPQLGVLLLCGLQEQRGDLLIAGLLGNGGEVGVLVPGLGFACESLPQVLLGLGAGVGVLGGFDLHKRACGLLADGADVAFGQRAFMHITADAAFPFFHCMFLRYLNSQHDGAAYHCLVD